MSDTAKDTETERLEAVAAALREACIMLENEAALDEKHGDEIDASDAAFTRAKVAKFLSTIPAEV